MSHPSPLPSPLPFPLSPSLPLPPSFSGKNRCFSERAKLAYRPNKNLYCYFNTSTIYHFFLSKKDYYQSSRGALGFSVLRFWPFFRSVFRFLHRKTSVFRFWCMLRFAVFSFLTFGFRFSAKIQAVFRIWDAMWFSVFPIWLPVKKCASTA